MIELLHPAFAIGLLVGFRHAFEPDHLAAVTTLATRERGLASAARLGLAWGAGHTASVAVLATLLIVVGIHVPGRFYRAAELLVAALLVLLGVGTILSEMREHRRALGAAHAHAGRVPHVHPPTMRSAMRALGFGVAHGLAGSGAIVVLLVAASSRVSEQATYLTAFGLGTIVGMCAVSWLTGATAGSIARTHRLATSVVRVSAACVSIGVGGMLGAATIGPWG